MNKQKALDKIANDIANCKLCKKDKIGLPVPGEGNSDAKIAFIGEAPGKKEAETGRPFVGRAGKLLRELISKAGLKDSEVFITSPVKYLPKHVTPTYSQIEHGRKHLFEQLKIIKPEIVVLMGRVACIAMLNKDCSIAQDHGKIIELKGISYFLSYHPAAPLYSPKLRAVITKDFKALKKLIKAK
ncbi:MAG: uracil-DNA glycosylase [Candidatus Doudnabacteria bacterium]|nr:uracil-DNA glycosylase [Candidatus Doudnabacteria bacterium]